MVKIFLKNLVNGRLRYYLKMYLHDKKISTITNIYYFGCDSKQIMVSKKTDQFTQ